MADSPNERPAGMSPPSTEEAERLAERFRPSWEVDPAEGASAVEVGARVAAESVAPLPPGVVTPAPSAVEASSLQAAAPAPLEPTGSLAAPTPAAEPPAPVPQAPRKSKIQNTLVGLQPPEPILRERESRPMPHKTTLYGIGIPEPVLPATHTPSPPLAEVFRAPEELVQPQPEPAAQGRPNDVPAPPAPANVELARTATAAVEPSPKPTGVAKPYHPKDGPDTPAVVVSPSVLEAELNARTERRRASRSQQTPTIPGTLRALPSTATASALDDDVDFRPKRSRTKLLVAVFVALGAAAGAAVFSMNAARDGARSSDVPIAPAEQPATQSPEPAVSPERSEPTPSASAEALASDAPGLSASALPAEPPPPALTSNVAESRPKAPRRAPAAASPTPKKAATKRPSSSSGASRSKAVIVRESPF